MLKEMTLDGTFTDKVKIAIDRLKQYEPPEGYYLAFSGGKDSIVCYSLAERSGVKFDAHYHFTTVDPPELVKFIKDNYPRVVWDKPKKSMFKLIEQRGFFPTRGIRYCCSELKEYGGKGQTIITGVRKLESKKRSKRELYETDMRNKKTHYLNPIINWLEEDVWEYIQENNLNYCSLYDEGFKRIGCIMCPLTNREQRLKEAARWPKFKRAYINAVDRGIKKKIEQGKRPILSGDNGESAMSWWLYGDQDYCAEQCELFG